MAVGLTYAETASVFNHNELLSLVKHFPIAIIKESIFPPV